MRLASERPDTSGPRNARLHLAFLRAVASGMTPRASPILASAYASAHLQLVPFAGAHVWRGRRVQILYGVVAGRIGEYADAGIRVTPCW